jgi:hypothetical protein
LICEYDVLDITSEEIMVHVVELLLSPELSTGRKTKEMLV